MQSPPKVTFRNMERSDAIEGHVMRRVEEVEKCFDRVIGCDVVIEAAQKRKLSGRAFKVHVALQIPGPDVVVTRLVARSKAAENVNLAIHEAFSAATRRLLARKDQMTGH
uniref:Sigma 54 modulation protein/ribosomal protein S30EA n=1 Tax=Chelativorans sp. (strain BNC1) TaxID=266779 RepID=Q11G12_CHESB